MIQDEAAQEHMIEYTDDFRQWFPLTIKVVGVMDLTLIDPKAPNRPYRFYRVINR